MRDELIGECRCLDCGRENSPTWVCPGCQKKRDERWIAENQKPAGMTGKHADIRESLEKISSYPWGLDDTNGCIWNVDGHRLMDLDVNVDPDDAEFIAAAPEYVRRLLDDVEQLKKRIRIIVKVESKLHYSKLENDRLRKALEEVFEYSKHDGIHYLLDKCYVTARKALEGKE